MRRPKALLDWEGKTLIEWQVHSLLEAGASEVIVVLGHQADAIAPHLNDRWVSVVVNEEYRQGKTTSIKAGVRSLPAQTKAIVLLAVDQPRPLRVVKRVISEHRLRGALITVPRYEGHRGHPVVFSVSLKPELEAISEERMGIREVMNRHKQQTHWIEADSPVVTLDMNTPEAYEEGKRMFLAYSPEGGR